MKATTRQLATLSRALERIEGLSHKEKARIWLILGKNKTYTEAKALLLGFCPAVVLRQLLAEEGVQLDGWKQPLPPPHWQPTTTSLTTGSYAAPKVPVVEWDVDGEILRLSPTFPIVDASGVKRLQSPRSSEAAITGDFQVIAMDVVTTGLTACGHSGAWELSPSMDKDSDLTILDSAQGPQQLQTASTPGLLDSGRGKDEAYPDFLLHINQGGTVKSCCFLEMTTPNVLGMAGLRSLTTCFNEPKNQQQGDGCETQHGPVEEVLGQAFQYAEIFGHRYFAISTYEVTWLCQLHAGRMWVSRGFSSQSAAEPTMMQGLMWLSLRAVFEGPPSPPQPPTPWPQVQLQVLPQVQLQVQPQIQPPLKLDGQGDSLGVEPGGMHVHDDAAVQSSPGGSDGCGGGGVSQQAAAGKLLLVHAAEEVGRSMTGIIHGGSLDGQPVAVKWSPYVEDQELLEHEGQVYTRLQSLQAEGFIPRLLYVGPSPLRRSFCLLTARVRGRPLTASDASLLPAALKALRAVHAAGLCHGDIRVDTFLVPEQGQLQEHGGWAQPVVLTDFECAFESSASWEEEEEEQELCDLLSVPHECPTTTSHHATARQATHPHHASARLHVTPAMQPLHSSPQRLSMLRPRQHLLLLRGRPPWRSVQHRPAAPTVQRACSSASSAACVFR